MAITVTLPIRTWAALDAALTFFRTAPAEVDAGRGYRRQCQRLHRELRLAGIRSRYVEVGSSQLGRCMLRLHVTCPMGRDDWLAVEFPRPAAYGLARCCLTVIEVQTDNDQGVLLEHEAEELQAASAFLSALRRDEDGVRLPERRLRRQLRWDSDRQEYRFAEPVAERVRQMYLRVGASLN